VAQRDALTRIRLAFYAKVCVLVMTLLLNVLLDDFVSDIAATDAEVSSGPHVAAPELASQVRKLVHQLERGLPLEHLEQSADRHLRRDAHEQMHVVFRDVTFHDGHFQVATDFADQFSDSDTDFSCHDRLAVLSDPDQMQMNLECSVRAAPVIFHAGESSMTVAPLHPH
jgi:hypothetical protein